MVSLYLFAASQVVVAPPPQDRCSLPPSLHDEIAKKYPSARVVTLADLDEYDRKLFQKDHGTRCPGLVKVNFYGDGKPTLALLLKAGEGSKQKAELVVARQLGEDWDLRSLETTDTAPVPVVSFASRDPTSARPIHATPIVRSSRPGSLARKPEWMPA